MAGTISKKGLPSRYAKIYDHFYGKFAEQKNYKITNEYKSEIMSHIFTHGGVSFTDLTIIDAMLRYKSPLAVSKVLKGYTKAQISKMYDTAVKHLYSPQNIATAVHNYYETSDKTHPLKETDFDGKKYILSALTRAGITYRSQLFIHLRNGWYYLWTIPGCGDGARQQILKAIDKWNEVGQKESK